jgi:aspartate carbamoyltransferase catalytic subunit
LFPHRHLLGIEPLARADIETILDLADAYVALNRRPDKHADALAGLTQINMFFEASTRTQASFELAGKRLGADVMNFGTSGSSIRKGETLIDTAMTLNAMHPDLLVVRHGASGAVALWPRRSTAPSSTPATAATSTRRKPCSTPSPSAAARAASSASPSRSAATSPIPASPAPT